MLVCIKGCQTAGNKSNAPYGGAAVQVRGAGRWSEEGDGLLYLKSTPGPMKAKANSMATLLIFTWEVALDISFSALLPNG